MSTRKPGSGAGGGSGDKMDTFDLPLFELLKTVDPDIKRMFEEFLNYTIFHERPLALDLKTRYLVLVGITTAVRNDREGIEWSSQLAMKHGATEREVLEAISLTNLPAGTPAMEYAADVWHKMRQGEASVQRRGTERQDRGFRAWSSWSRARDDAA
ncbi:carboxymuconolactone decarboxylase family protein [Paractinoplanes rhizophilus]|uniref:Carboxymuconolactone decarboxylase family protein n=1 Tax=Paractinoplanes rhizophilus TaxID=1416877 RepID=A0ABW2HX21_9ACTN|nr:carboxymuconolactone decarboxylase family protein [Actinoplanes sp.]